MLAAIRQREDRSAEEIGQSILAAMEEFSRGPQDDDATLLVARAY
jgi:serine phosphatase RsbU (regulator of sigma subunit)